MTAGPRPQAEGIEWNGSLESMSRKLVFDQVDPSSVTYCISAARENARQVREEISTEQWQRLNRLYHQIHSPNAEAQFRSSVSEMLASVVDGIYLFKGTTDTTMIHGQGWQFIRLGRYLERAYATATLLEVYQPELFQHPAEERAGHLYLELVGLLRCCTSFEAYCQVYTADLSPDRILEFLLFNREFPHAICYCVEGARQAIEAIQRIGRPPRPRRDHRRHRQAALHARYSPPSAKFLPASRRISCTTSARSVCAFTSSFTGITCSTPFSRRYRLKTTIGFAMVLKGYGRHLRSFSRKARMSV